MIPLKILNFIGNTLWGFRPNLMSDIVEINGGWKSVGWFIKNMPNYERVLKAWGAERTHLMAVGISSLTGCPYCTYGHAYSFQLNYFKNRAKLFPVDEHEMVKFNALSESELINTLNDLYDSHGFEESKSDINRYMILKDKPELAESKDDKRILQLIEVFKLLNFCGIKNKTESDFAHSPINKDVENKRNYEEARKQSSLN